MFATLCECKQCLKELQKKNTGNSVKHSRPNKQTLVPHTAYIDMTDRCAQEKLLFSHLAGYDAARAGLGGRRVQEKLQGSYVRVIELVDYLGVI